MPSPSLRLRGQLRTIDGTLIMGVINASPESFSDAGRFRGLAAQQARCEELLAAGADIIDVGGQSAITNRPEVAVPDEIDRVLPIITWLTSQHPGVLVSIDTYKPPVAEAALRAGASILNDVSGLRSVELADICRRYDAALILMHTSAKPLTRLQDPQLYGDVASEVLAFLQSKMAIAIDRGLPQDAIILDPGPDFTKTPSQTVEMLRQVDVFRGLGRPLLLALSRKDFLGAVTGRPPGQRDAATHAAIAHFAGSPGNIVRVHDVAGARDSIAVSELLHGIRDLDAGYLLPDSIRHEPPSQ